MTNHPGSACRPPPTAHRPRTTLNRQPATGGKHPPCTACRPGSTPCESSPTGPPAIVWIVPLLIAALSCAGVAGHADGTPERVRYTLRFPAPQTHYVEVEAQLPTSGGASLDVMMPVWTPGSYLVREYSRNVEGLTARSAEGRALPVTKTRKNHWRVTTNGTRQVSLSYRVYARQLIVQGNWVDSEFAMLNGASTFITLADGLARPHEVRLELPPEWKTSVSGLAAAPGGAPNAFVAADYDTLVDSPIVAGNPAMYPFVVAGVPHTLVNVSEAGVWDGPRSVADVQKIVEANERLWGRLPYPRYVFLNVLGNGGGGLEHKTSTVMLASRWATRTREGYLRWLGLVSHEYFHAWNVKLLRPVELGPFDYDNENYTTGLWVSEGFTDYYGDLILARASLASRDEFLAGLSRQVAELQTTPGRSEHPLSMSSYDAWIKAYRPDENAVNTTISYYTKGAVVAFLLDAHVRQLTRGEKSLDDVMRLAFARYSGPAGFTTEQFRQAAREVAGRDLSAWFARAVDSTEELDYQPALDWFGLGFGAQRPSRAQGGWLGVQTRNDSGRITITQVRRGTPGYDAGLNVDDEIVGIDDLRVRAGELDTRLRQYQPGQRVSVLVARRERLQRVEVTLGTEPSSNWSLYVREDATPDQRARLDAWLGAEDRE